MLELIKRYQRKVPAVLLTVARTRYLFNVPETYQRFALQHAVPHSISHYFLTSLDTEHLAGLLGLLQTLFSEKKGEGIKIYGPAGTAEWFRQLRQTKVLAYNLSPFSFYSLFAARQSDQLSQSVAVDEERLLLGDSKLMNAECQSKEDFLQEAEKLAEEVVAAKVPESTQKGLNNAAQHINARGHFQDENLELIAISITDGKARQRICFVGVLDKPCGKVVLEKLAAFGIEGKMIGKIVREGRLTLQDGREVHLSDVSEVQAPAPLFILLDLPDEVALHNLIQNGVLEKFLQVDAQQQKIQTIVHLTAQISLIQSQAYQNYFFRFGEDVQHIICANCEDGATVQESISEFHKSTQVYLRKNFDHHAHIQNLNLKYPQYYPSGFEAFKKVSDIASEESGSIQLSQLPLLWKRKALAKKYFQFTMNPAHAIGYNILPNMPALQEEMAQQQQFEATIHLKANIPHVIMLGTGSMLPSKHRNVSSCFVQLKSDFALLIDCGEGTLMQLYERAVAEGRDKHAFEAQLLSIRCILITHFHSDHMLGLLAFLKEWDRISSRSQKNSSQELYVVMPLILQPFFELYQKHIDRFVNIHFTCTQFFSPSEQQQLTEEDVLNNFTAQRMDIGNSNNGAHLQIFKTLHTNYTTLCEKQLHTNKIEIQAVAVPHCEQSYAYIIASEEFKIAHSGDSRPSEAFANAARDCTLMVHECTFCADCFQKNAETHAHSTLREGLAVAMRSNAQYLWFNHFSQRYTQLHDLSEDKNLLETIAAFGPAERQYFDTRTLLPSDDQMGVSLHALDAFVRDVRPQIQIQK